jgi:hypothetical protein
LFIQFLQILYNNAEEKSLPHHRQRTFEMIKAKKLEEFVQILGNEFEFKNEKVDRNNHTTQYPNFKERPNRSPGRKL